MMSVQVQEVCRSPDVLARNRIRDLADEISSLLNHIPGAEAVFIQPPSTRDPIQLYLNPDKLEKSHV